MTINRAWDKYAPTYRKEEMKTMTKWIAEGRSCTVLGLGGSGKSNFLGFLSHHPKALQHYLPTSKGQTILIPVDLNNLVENSLSILYRTILRDFHENCTLFDEKYQLQISKLYFENRGTKDPFISQSALRELFYTFQKDNIRIVLVLDRFDHFCEFATPVMFNTLRGFRDGFKSTLSYIIGMRQHPKYLPNLFVAGELYEILDRHICWVGKMNEADAKRFIDEETFKATTPPSESAIKKIIELSGGYPSLLKAVCSWWLSAKDKDKVDWKTVLLEKHSIQHRLEEIWEGLTQEERSVLVEVLVLQEQSLQKNLAKRKIRSIKKECQKLAKNNYSTLNQLSAKRICYLRDIDDKQIWYIDNELLRAYIHINGKYVRGKIYMDYEENNVYQGNVLLEKLDPLAKSALQFFIQNPYQQLKKTEIIFATWNHYNIADANLHAVIGSIRKRIELNSSKPHYLHTWRGRHKTREGGYIFYPEGKPQ